ncbi:hypothetical protein DVH24_013497 [Malus domestica]|uniref:Uncharacterized protein n=1 Tax=Malus domestica TaxID=3750 RepID=A0A498HNL5_MALDO|nr:hypothetical protein DVH24_013497 [Malus domestica]
MSFLERCEASAMSSTHNAPPLSTAFIIDTRTDSLQGNHFETCKKGMTEPDLNGEIPKQAGAKETPKKVVEGMIEIMLLSLAVTAAALNVSDEGVEGDRVVVVECRSEGELDRNLRQQ